jgi:hypothetical protein
MPEFASREYWDERFSNDSSRFDWLVPAIVLCDIADEWVEADGLRKADILHIGCGTSDSSILRRLVDNPSQIHNVDYSATAVEAERAREQETLAKEPEDQHDQPWVDMTSEKRDSVQPSSPQAMRWSCLDLLSLDSTISLMEQQYERGRLFDLILDKSTSDSISCGANLNLQLPFPLSINGWTRGVLVSGVAQLAEIHPLHILAVHLAALTTPRTGKWITISYSEDRFPFLPPFPQSASHGFLAESTIQAGFPHPNKLWRLEAKEKIEPEAQKEETLAQRRKRLKEGIIHRPQVSHWLYILVRTDVVVTD